MSDVLDGVGRSHLLMPSIGMASDSWKTERSASQPLSPMPPSPFPSSPIPSPASNPIAHVNNSAGHAHHPPSYSPPPATFSLSPPASAATDVGVVPPIEVHLLPSSTFPITLPDGHSSPFAATARSIYSSDASDDPPSPRSSHRSAAALLWPSVTLGRIPLEQLRSLSFNCFDYSSDQLLLCTVDTLQSLHLIDGLHLSLPHLQTFLLSIRAHYRVNPYHDFFHGFAVFQFGYYMLTESRLRHLLTPHDQLVLLISCLCHDVDHPGTTNSFQVAVNSGLARIHNDVAVLENHHAFITCEMMRSQHSNFLAHMSAAQFRTFRKMVIQAILATDMAVHFDLCRQFARLDSDLGQFKAEQEDDRQLVINVLTHSSDLSAQVMEFPIASAWEERVTREFTAQWRLERSLGQVETPFMQNLHRPKVRYKNHLGFLDGVMKPLWTVVSDVLPPMAPCLSNLLSNRQHYDRRLASAKDAASEEEAALLADLSLPSSSVPSSSAISVESSAAPSPSITQSHSPESTSPHPQRSASASASAAPSGSSSASQSSPASPVAYRALRDEEQANGAEDAKLSLPHARRNR